VAQASDGAEALTSYRTHLPDITLMDLRMPNTDGVTAIESIRSEFPGARIIVLTTYRGDVQATRALKAGAVGYVLKSMLRTELMKTIRAVHSGQRCIPPEIQIEVSKHYPVDSLSMREIEILRWVASGCSNKIVGDRLKISEDTVKTHMKSILAKLQANDRTHAVTIALKRGFLGT
jgi:DNA-binding NarL/FixJ family response regulator